MTDPNHPEGLTMGRVSFGQSCVHVPASSIPQMPPLKPFKGRKERIVDYLNSEWDHAVGPDAVDMIAEGILKALDA